MRVIQKQIGKVQRKRVVTDKKGIGTEEVEECHL